MSGAAGSPISVHDRHRRIGTAFEQVRRLPPEVRERVRLALADMLAEAEADLDDPEYRAYVEQALEEAEADYRAARYSSLDEAIDLILKDFARRHGV